MTRQPDFTGIWIKVERAKEHFGDLTTRYKRFRNAKPYETFAYDEPDTGDLVYKVKVSDQPLLWWSAIAEDCVHNLRSSLDLLVCELVRAEGHEVEGSTSFPVFQSESAFTNSFEPGPPGQLKGAPQSAVDLIKWASLTRERTIRSGCSTSSTSRTSTSSWCLSARCMSRTFSTSVSQARAC